MDPLQDSRELVARACRILGNLDLTKATQGHVSLRLPGSDRILIRARGPGESGVRYTEPGDVITVDLRGKKIAGPEGLEPPQEVFIHTWIYKTRPEMQSVIHIHPLTPVLFTICNKPLLPLVGAYDPGALRMAVEGIPTYPRSILISNDQRGQEFAEAMGDKRVCLMRAHGLTTAGGSLQEATLTAITLNDLAEVNYRASLLGDPEPISPEDIETFARLLEPAKEGESRSNRASDAHGRLDAAWRYYSRLADRE
jgi:L-fuculose-phosphate aldolase